MGRTNGGKRGELVGKIVGHAAWNVNGKSVKTLMRMRVDQLQSMLDGLEGLPTEAPVLQDAIAVATVVTDIPTDREIYAQAAKDRSAKDGENEPKTAEKEPANRWIALALTPWLLLCRVVGL